MLLQVENLYKRFSNGIQALDGVSLHVASGENTSLVGESGCGKTTLARIVMGLAAADRGRVLFEGREISAAGGLRREFLRFVRMVFQDPFSSLDPRYPVRAVLKEALCLEPRMTSGEEYTRMRRILDLVHLPGDILARYPHEFSGGERQRIAIARSMMTEPRLLILDEAVSSLDVLVQKDILQMLEELHRRTGVTYLFISHNLRAVRRLSRKVAVMYQGRIVEYGEKATLFDAPSQAYTQTLLKAAFHYE